MPLNNLMNFHFQCEQMCKNRPKVHKILFLILNNFCHSKVTFPTSEIYKPVSGSLVVNQLTIRSTLKH